MRFVKEDNALVFFNQGEMGRIEPWGKDSFRVRSSMHREFTGKRWALTEEAAKTPVQIEVAEEDHWVGDGTIDKREIATIVNGRLKAVVNFAGIISFYRDDSLILREYFRAYDGTLSKESRCLKVVHREWKGVMGGSEYSLKLKFESNDGEKIFGMGQYQQPYLDLKG